MEIEELEIVLLELKYCERCGGLWLRQRGSGDVYCGGCAEQVARLPVRRRKATQALPINSRSALKKARGEGKMWSATVAEGGNA